MDFADKDIGKIDAKTGKNSLFPAPTAGRPRRGTMDAADRLWFAESTGDRIGMFDTKTETFKDWEAPSAPRRIRAGPASSRSLAPRAAAAPAASRDWSCT
jgi:streptogramin lyase